MNTKQKFNELIKNSCDFISDKKLYDDIMKDLEILEKIKTSIFESEDNCYYIDLVITKNNENKDIYNWIEENN